MNKYVTIDIPEELVLHVLYLCYKAGYKYNITIGDKES